MLEKGKLSHVSAQPQETEAEVRAQFEKAIGSVGGIELHDWQIARIADECVSLREKVPSFSVQSIDGIMMHLKETPKKLWSKKILGYFGAARNLVDRTQKLVDEHRLTPAEAEGFLGNIGLVGHEILSARLRDYEAQAAAKNRKNRKYNMRHNSRA